MSGSTATTTTSASSIATSAANAAIAERPRLAGDFSTFLSLLTTQLKNQSPTEPLDTNQMTAQLVQFASVEQQIAMNQNLGRLLALEQSAQLTAAAPLIGRRVEVVSDQLALQGGAAELRLPAAGTAIAARVAVLDGAGRLLHEDVVQLRAGETAWQWDGRDASGHRLNDGAYRVAVTGFDRNGEMVELDFTVVGKATAAERRDGQVNLLLGPLEVGFDRVLGLAVDN